MAIGPVQLLVIGFDHPDFKGEVLEEIERLRDTNTIRIIDSLTVIKDADGDAVAVEMSNLTADEAVELGSTVGALIGLGAAGESGAEIGAEGGADLVAEEGIHVFDEETAWDVIEDIPNDSAAVILLIEHHWAARLRDATSRAGGFPISDGMVHAADLVRVGLLGAAEYEAQQAMERES